MPEKGDVASAFALYTFFPLNLLFGFGDRLFQSKDENVKGWKKHLKDNMISRFFAAFMIVMGVNQGVQQISGLTFEAAQQYLQKAGYPEHVIKELAAENIRVRNRDTYGMIHTWHDYPPFMSLVLESQTGRAGNDALTAPGTGLGTLLNTNKWLKMVKPYMKPYLARFVTLPAPGTTGLDAVSQLGEIPKELLSGLPSDDQKIKQAMMLYIFRLLDSEKDLGSFESKSAEAYVYAFQAISEMYNDPAFARIALHMSALDFDDDMMAHHEALIIEAHFSGAPHPKEKDTEKAVQELRDLFPERYNSYEEGAVKKTQVIQDIIQNKRASLSPLALRRAELYIEAVEYFAPALLQKNTPSAAAAPIPDIK